MIQVQVSLLHFILLISSHSLSSIHTDFLSYQPIGSFLHNNLCISCSFCWKMSFPTSSHDYSWSYLKSSSMRRFHKTFLKYLSKAEPSTSIVNLCHISVYNWPPSFNGIIKSGSQSLFSSGVSSIPATITGDW